VVVGTRILANGSWLVPFDMGPHEQVRGGAGDRLPVIRGGLDVSRFVDVQPVAQLLRPYPGQIEESAEQPDQTGIAVDS
jgi:hypothetical protein